MGLNWKDLIGAIGVLVVGGIYYAHIKALDIPLVSNARWAAILMLVAGMFVCAFSSRVSGNLGSSPLMISLSVLGVATLLLVLYALVTGNKTALLGIVITTVLLWLVATLRHLIAK